MRGRRGDTLFFLCRVPDVFLMLHFPLPDTLPVMLQFGEGFHRERLAAEVALAGVAALVAQLPELFAGFDALGDHLNAERVGHDDDGAHDGASVAESAVQ